MRSFPFVVCALLCSVPASGVAQAGSEANLVLTILGGVVTGHSLWTVDRQPLCVLDAINQCTSQYDTLHMSRSINSSIVLGASGVYFPSPHVGFHVEISYLGLPMDTECRVVGAFNPDADGNKNQQICDDLTSQAAGGGAITIFGGVTLRAAPRRAFSPYARGSIGLVNQSRSTIEVVGAYVNSSGNFFERQVIQDPKPRRNTVMVGAAVGFTSPLGPGYQFRLEARDLVTSLNRLTGPANGLGLGPTATRSYHHFALTIGFDVVLEKSRGRRY
jgi:hypothetical protein